MKKLVILSLLSVIGMGLWSGTVMADTLLVRNIPLTCGDDPGPVNCWYGGSSISIYPWAAGSPTGQGNRDGSLLPYVSLNINRIMCQSDGAASVYTVEGPRQFYVLYIEVSNSGTPIRIGTFNTGCNTLMFHSNYLPLPPKNTNTIPPQPHEPTEWFTEDLEVTVALEADDGLDLSLQDVLVGSD